MSDAKQCDRCKNFYPVFGQNKDVEKDYWRYDVVKDCHPFESLKLDLCNDCKKKLVEWLGVKS